MLWQSDVAHWQAGGLGHSTHFNVTTTAMAPRQLLSQPHCRDGPGTRSWAEYGAAAHARCVAPTLDHFGANSGQKRPGIRPAWLGHGAPRERQRHRSVRRTKTAYFSHCGCEPRLLPRRTALTTTVLRSSTVAHCARCLCRCKEAGHARSPPALLDFLHPPALCPLCVVRCPSLCVGHTTRVGILTTLASNYSLSEVPLDRRRMVKAIS